MFFKGPLLPPVAVKRPGPRRRPIDVRRGACYVEPSRGPGAKTNVEQARRVSTKRFPPV